MRQKRHQLSEFLCREMLYDFATGLLDPVRKKAVEENLKEYPELETEFESLKQGLAYAKKLSQTQVSPQTIEAVLLKKSFTEHVLGLFRLYKWRVAVAGFVFLVGLLWMGWGYWQSVVKMPDHILWSVESIEEIKPKHIPADHVNEGAKQRILSKKGNQSDDSTRPRKTP